jgi:hypothetical protein
MEEQIRPSDHSLHRIEVSGVSDKESNAIVAKGMAHGVLLGLITAKDADLGDFFGEKILGHV